MEFRICRLTAHAVIEARASLRVARYNNGNRFRSLFLADAYRVQAPLEINDLNIQTALTLVEPITESGCDGPSSGFTFTVYNTAYVGDSAFTAIPETIELSLETGTYAATYVFPELILTILSPGQAITLVIFHSHK